MNSGKIKSLKLQRNSQRNETPSKVQSKDDSMTFAEEAKSHVQRVENPLKQESLTPVHSTPKRSNGTQDQSNLEYRVSPILLPCTQDGGIEVAWDWHSPITKSKNRKIINNVESSGTPKRTTALQKKRSSNSPLLYKPIKRQLMKDPQQLESLDKFAAEIKALSEHIKSAPREEQKVETTDESSDKNEDELLIQIDISDFEGEAKYEVTTSDDRSSTKNVLKTSMDDLFDDSIDDSMVKCSQEVEEKLKLESCAGNFSQSNSNGSNGTKDFSWHQQSYSRYVAERDKSDAAGNAKIAVNTISKDSSNDAKKFAVPSTSSSLTTFSKSESRISFPTKSSTSSSGNSRNESKTLFATKSSTSSSGNSRNESKTSSATKSSTSSSGFSRNESKTSSSATSSSSSGNTNKFNLATKPSSFSIKVPSNSAKTSNLKKKIPTIEAKTSFGRENVKESSAEASLLDDIFEIPDDSFDEFLAVDFDDVEEIPSSTKNNQQANQTSSRYGKIYDGPSSAKSGTNTTKSSFQPPQTSGSNSSFSKNSTKVFPRSVSNDSINSTPKIVPQTSAPQSQASQARKFFKSKSHSTSSFEDSGMKNLSNSSSSSKVWKTNLFLNGNVSVSTEQQKNQQQNTSQNNAWSRTNGNVGNTGMYNVNRNGPKEDDSNRFKREVATGSQTQQICTPAEIERKRMEAKMRLEAKKKIMARSTSDGTLSGGKLKRPDKR